MENPASTPPADPPRWNPATRVAFRFCFVYCILFFLSGPFSYFPFSDYLFYYFFAGWNSFWGAAVPWVGAHVLHLAHPITVLPNGSGDTTWNYVQALCLLVFAGAVAAGWSLLDRRRREYRKLYQWLRLFVRLFLAANLINYGLDKVISLQMPQPSLLTLATSFGDIPPGGLLWAFIGASPVFEIFTGIVETVGGLLLILPRTTVLGAIVGTASMFFVFALNLCYDIPVKLYSFHLLALGIFLLAPEFGRFFRLLLLGERVELTKPAPLFSRPWLNVLALVLQVGFGLFVFHNYLNGLVQSAEYVAFSPKSPLYGIWLVSGFTVNGQPPPAEDSSRWRMVIFDRPGAADICEGEHKVVNYNISIGTGKKSLRLSQNKGPGFTFACSQTGPGRMTLSGDLEGRHLDVELRRLDENQYILTTRGFHWINEHPYF